MQGFARATSYIPSQVSFTTTGNIDNLDFSGADLIRMNNASDATIRGLLAGTPGQRVTIVSIGAGNVYLAHQNTNSTAANRLLNFATSGSTPVAAGVGSAVYQYDGTTQRWRLISHVQGSFITPTFAAGDYTGGGSQTWTVEAADVSTFGYLLEGRTLTMQYNLVNTTVGGTPDSDLRRAMPNSFTVAKTVAMLHSYSDNGTVGVGEVLFTTSANTLMTFRRAILTATNWTASTNLTDMRGMVKVEVT